MDETEPKQLTEEDLRNMSPQELLELERRNCIFCNIISGQIPSRKVHEDERVIAVLDINPATAGHMLLMTREHYQIMPQIPDELVLHLGETARMLSHASLKGLHARGTTVFIANGAVAGQRAPHFIIHIIPRDPGDGVGLLLPEGLVSEEENRESGSLLRERLQSLMGRAPGGIKEETGEMKSWGAEGEEAEAANEETAMPRPEIIEAAEENKIIEPGVTWGIAPPAEKKSGQARGKEAKKPRGKPRKGEKEKEKGLDELLGEL